MEQQDSYFQKLAQDMPEKRLLVFLLTLSDLINIATLSDNRLYVYPHYGLIGKLKEYYPSLGFFSRTHKIDFFYERVYAVAALQNFEFITVKKVKVKDEVKALNEELKAIDPWQEDTTLIEENFKKRWTLLKEIFRPPFFFFKKKWFFTDINTEKLVYLKTLMEAGLKMKDQTLLEVGQKVQKRSLPEKLELIFTENNEVKIKGYDIVIGKPHDNKLGYFFMQQLIDKEKTRIDLKFLIQYAKDNNSKVYIPKDITMWKILENMNIKKNLLKLFFEVTDNRIIFTNPVKQNRIESYFTKDQTVEEFIKSQKA